MDLIERYVNDVGRRLPKSQRDEVRQELRSALLDALETPAASGDRAPTEEDVVSALRELGPPSEVAASYRPADQYLIGPELYPHFKRVVGIVMAVLLTLLVGSFAISFLARPAESAELGQRLFGFIDRLFDSVWVTFAIVVLIFGGLQRLDVRPEKRRRVWDPRQLPAVVDSDLVGRGEAAVHIVVPAIFLALLLLFRDHIGLVVNPGGELLLNDILARFLPWAGAAILLGMALYTYLFWRGRWGWPSRLSGFAIDVFGLLVLYRIVAAVTAEKATLLAAGVPAPVPTVIVQTAWAVLAVAAVVVAIDFGKPLVRLFPQG